MSAPTRETIIATADRLFYERGFEATSFANIAEKVGISRGNFYYHFKTKDEILEAVILRRLAFTQDMLAQWQAEGKTPVDRIRLFIHILVRNQTKIMQHGCQVGTLCSELSKQQHPALAHATRLFTLFRLWLSGQFTELGLTERADSLAMHLLMRSQGVATLAQSFQDEAFVHEEVRLMDNWLNDLIDVKG